MAHLYIRKQSTFSENRKYTRIYSGGVDPQLIEADIFKIIIPTTPQATEQATEQVILAQMISFCQKARTSKEMTDYLGLKHREHFRSEILKPLIDQKKLFMTFPVKPRSPKQKYSSQPVEEKSGR